MSGGAGASRSRSVRQDASTGDYRTQRGRKLRGMQPNMGPGGPENQ